MKCIDVRKIVVHILIQRKCIIKRIICNVLNECGGGWLLHAIRVVYLGIHVYKCVRTNEMLNQWHNVEQRTKWECMMFP